MKSLKDLIAAVPAEPTPRLSEDDPEDRDALRRLRWEKREEWLRKMTVAEQQDYWARKQWEQEHPRPLLHGSPWDNYGRKMRFKRLKELDALRAAKRRQEEAGEGRPLGSRNAHQGTGRGRPRPAEGGWYR